MFAFNALSFVLRWLLCLFVVFATYNVTGYSYYHWITGDYPGDSALKTLAGCLLLIAYGNFIIVSWRSMGPVGISAASAILTTLFYLLDEYALLDFAQPYTMATITGFFFATLLAVGISLSHVKVRLIGQTESHYVEYY